MLSHPNILFVLIMKSVLLTLMNLLVAPMNINNNVFIYFYTFINLVLCWVFLFVLACVSCAQCSHCLSLYCPFLKFVHSVFIYVYYKILQECSAAYNKITTHVINGPSMSVKCFLCYCYNAELSWLDTSPIYRAQPTNLLLSSQVADQHALPRWGYKV